MKLVRCWFVVLVCTVLSAFFSACGGGGGDGDPVPTVDVTGTWDGYSDVGMGFVATLQQTGANVSGTLKNVYGDTGSLAGIVDGNTAEWEMIWYSGATGTYKAEVVGNHMTGTGNERFGNIKGSFAFTAKRR